MKSLVWFITESVAYHLIFGTAVACVLVMIAPLLRWHRFRRGLLTHRRRAVFGRHLFGDVSV